MKPSFEIENLYPELLVAGMDEVGRGSVAGPVVSSCVVLDRKKYLPTIDDSKVMSKRERKLVYQYLIKHSKFGIGVVSNRVIDNVNILNATKISMRLAYYNLCKKYANLINIILIDGNFYVKNLGYSIVRTIVKGDKKSLSIAAASIIAKEYRDKIMLDHNISNCYKWNKNKGYLTREHKKMIDLLGVSPYHRTSFLRKYVDSTSQS